MSYRTKAIQWAKRMMTEDFVILDTETTGLGQTDVVIQIALINPHGEVYIDTLIKPYKLIPAAATVIHGITNEMTESAPSFTQMLPQIDKALRGKRVLIYNKEFDRNMIFNTAEIEGIEKFNWWWYSPESAQVGNKEFREWAKDPPWQCVMNRFAEFYGDWSEYHGNHRWQRLGVAAQYFGVPVEDEHSALGDARLTLAVLKGMSEADE